MYSQEFKDFIHFWFGKLLETNIFGLYQIKKITFKEEDEFNNNSGEPTCIEVDISESYLTININVFPAAFKKFEKQGKEYFLLNHIVHELCHIITTPFDNLARERFVTDDVLDIQDEKLTEILARFVGYYLNKEGFLKQK